MKQIVLFHGISDKIVVPKYGKDEKNRQRMMNIGCFRDEAGTTRILDTATAVLS